MTVMNTQIIRVDAEHPSDSLLLPAAMALRQGQLVAFPTETVYGLGANALDAAAVRAIYDVKGRPGDNPMIVHVTCIADLLPLVQALTPLAEKLFKAFSPGPLTLVMLKSPEVPDVVTAGLDTVAVRIPSHPVARRLIELAGVPVAAPSANRSGRPSPTRAWHVELDLAGRIPFIIEAGNSEFGLESTVVDVTADVPVILRPGTITAAAIREIAGTVLGAGAEMAANDRAPRSPGMKYRHYAPRAKVVIADNPDLTARALQVRQMADNLITDGQRVGVFGCAELLTELPEQAVTVIYGQTPDAAAAGALLFDALRRLDQAKVTVIIAEGLSDRGVGAAYMNRLRKAADTMNKEK